jgi:hypothetical protein
LRGCLNHPWLMISLVIPNLTNMIGDHQKSVTGIPFSTTKQHGVSMGLAATHCSASRSSRRSWQVAIPKKLSDMLPGHMACDGFRTVTWTNMDQHLPWKMVDVGRKPIWNRYVWRVQL